MAYTTDPNGIPILDPKSLLSDVPAYTQQIANHLAARNPIGTVQMCARLTPPAGWLLCDGDVIDKVAYPDLHEALELDGYPYGGDAAGARVPDLRGRVVAGAGPGVGGGQSKEAGNAPSGGENLADRAPGTWGGDERMHAHSHGGKTGDDSPDHSHSIWHGFWVKTAGGLVGSAGDSFIDVTSHPDTGGATTRHQHSISQDGTGTQQNLMPYMTLNFVILATHDL